MVRPNFSIAPLTALALSVFRFFFLADALEYIPEHSEKCVYQQIEYVSDLVDCAYSNTEDSVCQKKFKKLWKKLTRSQQGRAPVCSADYPPFASLVSVVGACKEASFREQQCDDLTDSFLELAHGGGDFGKCKDDEIRCPDGSFVGRDPQNNCKFYDCPFDGCSGSKRYCWDGSYVEQDPYDYCRYPDCPGCSNKKKYCWDGSFVYQDPRDNCKYPDCPDRGCSDVKKRCPDGSYVYQDPDNYCKYPDCPSDYCAQDARKCPNGDYVSRDRYNGCDFKPCCCDPKDEPGRFQNSFCFEGHKCCPDGTWSCSIGDNKSFSCDGHIITKGFGVACNY
mmetsp:Transcript_3035/g.4158  ORF Transcript_3035/g.4158 Transcript_3035/m.4158 type:complete len:335 (+) Transcript_3035:1-1005(+)